MKIITSDEMARLDAASFDKPEILMERAGEGLADFIYDYMPRYPVCFICGSGNNGGDGFVAARYLIKRGWEVEVYLTSPIKKLKDLPKKQAEKLEAKIEKLDPDKLKYILNRNKIVIDCILGTGFTPPLREDIKNILEIINKKSKITLACDMPTGVSGDTGKADKCSIDADITVTFEYPKAGHLLSPGSNYTGSLEVIDIGIDLSPEEYIKDCEFTVRQDCSEYFTRRSKESHKKSYGHILVIGGSPGMEGAVSMSALGSLRTGAGLVTCAVGNSIAPAVSAESISSMVLGLEEEKNGYLEKDNVNQILDFIEKRKIDCVVLGPGISFESQPKKLVKSLIDKIQCPVVLDADGINCIGADVAVLKKRKQPLFLTPHPGEMAGLTGKTVKEIQKDRVKAAKEIAKKTGSIVILKGFRTVVTDGTQVFINATGNPGMATGGSGDILSGILAALIGQGFSEIDSARAAVWVHGRAGDIAALEYGQKYILPENILEGISKV